MESGRSRGAEFAISPVNDSIINFTREERGARMRRPPQCTYRIVSDEIGRAGLHTGNGLVPSAMFRKVRPVAETKKAAPMVAN